MDSPDLIKARNVTQTIRNLLTYPTSELVRVPEIERERPQDAIRKLQIQVFELTDALAAAVRELERRTY